MLFPDSLIFLFFNSFFLLFLSLHIFSLYYVIVNIWIHSILFCPVFSIIIHDGIVVCNDFHYIFISVGFFVYVILTSDCFLLS
jgi:hypothetical protein